MFESLLGGFATVISPVNLLFCFFGVTMGTIIGVLPGRRAGRRDGDARSLHLRHESHHRHHHAGRHLLRGHVRRLDHFHPGQPSRGIVIGHDLPGRLPDGPEREGRRGSGHGRHRLLHRRHPERDRAHAAGAPPCRFRDPFRPARILCPDGPGHDPGHFPGGGIPGQGADRRRVRDFHRHRRHGPHYRDRALLLRHPHPSGRAQLRERVGGPLCHLRGAGDGRTVFPGPLLYRQDLQPASQPGGLETVYFPDPPRERDRLFCLCHARRGRHRRFHAGLRHRKEGSPSTRKNSGRGSSRASPPRRAPTTPPPAGP